MFTDEIDLEFLHVSSTLFATRVGRLLKGVRRIVRTPFCSHIFWPAQVQNHLHQTKTWCACVNVLQGVEVCETKQHVWVVCADVNAVTEDGVQCASSFTYQGVARSFCVNFNGFESCPTDGNEKLQKCVGEIARREALQPRYVLRWWLGAGVRNTLWIALNVILINHG